ncbi:hypothetical protein K469DRAFT_582655, partial [Zopfia rhizophila CBS 207.26]
LLKIAFDILLIPALSCDYKRMFLELSDILEPQQRKLSVYLITVIQWVRAWRKYGFRRMYIHKACITYN